MAKSRLALEDLRLWLKKKTEDLMTMGYGEMADEDREFADIAIEDSPPEGVGINLISQGNKMIDSFLVRLRLFRTVE
jgi:hypothetical protein